MDKMTKVLVLAAMVAVSGGAVADVREDAIRINGQTIGETAREAAIRLGGEFPGPRMVETQMVDTWFRTIGEGADPAAGARASCHIYGMAPVRIEKAELRAGPYETYLVRCGSIALSGHHVKGTGIQ